MTLRRFGTCVVLCLFLAGCGGLFDDDESTTSAQQQPMALSEGPLDTASLPQEPAAPTGEQDPLAALPLQSPGLTSSWSGTSYQPGMDQRNVHVAVLDGGGTWALELDANQDLVALKRTTLPEPLTERFDASVTRYGFDSHSADTETWVVEHPAAWSLNTQSSSLQTVEMSDATQVDQLAPTLADQAGTWKLRLAFLGGSARGPVFPTADAFGHFAAADGECQLTGTLETIRGAVQWVALHLVVSPGCQAGQPAQGPADFRGYLRWIDPSGRLVGALTTQGGQDAVAVYLSREAP